MGQASQPSVFQYLRLFSYLLIIYGIIGIAVGIAVAYGAFNDMGNPDSLPLAPLVLGICALAVSGLTIATGLIGRLASKSPDRLHQLHELSIAGVVATVLALGLCHVVGAGLPTSLLFSLLLLVICLVIANNLAKSSQ